MFPQSSTTIYCFLSGTHSYIDGTKNLANMKKRLRYQLPRTPLKVLRGEKDEEDIMDKYYERFKAPTSTSEDDDNSDGYSTRSSLPRDDTGEVSDEGMARYLGSSLESINPIDDVRDKRVKKHQRNNRDDQTTSSISHEAIEMQVLAQVHHPPDTDTNSEVQDYANQINNTGYQTTGSVSHEAIEMQVLAQVHQSPDTGSDEDAMGGDIEMSVIPVIKILEAMRR